MSDRKYDPQQPYKLWLKECAEIPDDERPTFTYRRLSGREFTALVEKWEYLADETATRKSRLNAMMDGAKLGLLGWDRQTDITTGDDVPFNPDDLDLIIDHKQAVEIIESRLFVAEVSNDDKKKSE